MEREIREIMRANGRDPEKRLGDLMEQDDRDIKELVDDARNSPGAQIKREVSLIYTTLEIVNKNYQELAQSRDWYLDQGLELWDMDNREELEAFQREYLRRLHNYSASVHTLIEHVYTILDRYEDDKPGLKNGYFSELQDRNLGTKVDLIKQLRHYTQKRELPPVAASLQSECVEGEDEHETELKIILKKSEMMDWNGWDADVRERLGEMDDDVDITDLASDFQHEIIDFFDWFRKFMLRMFYDEIEKQVVTMALLDEDKNQPN